PATGFSMSFGAGLEVEVEITEHAVEETAAVVSATHVAHIAAGITGVSAHVLTAAHVLATGRFDALPGATGEVIGSIIDSGHAGEHHGKHHHRAGGPHARSQGAGPPGGGIPA